MEIKYILLCIVGILTTTNLSIFIIKKMKPNMGLLELEVRLKMWWGMILVFGLATLFNTNISVLSLMILCMLCLKEYFSLIKMKKGDRRILFWAYLSVPIHFYWILTDWYGMFIIFIPVFVFLFMPLPRIFSGITSGFLRNISAIQWGLMLMVFGLSHLAYFPKLTTEYGGLLVLYSVILTQIGDVVQIITSKICGKHPIAPTADKNKTWQGLIASVITVTGLAMVLSPLLTPMNFYYGVLSGFIISIAGFMGGVVISMVKRDMSLDGEAKQIHSVEKSFLSKVDSLAFTVPLFFHFIRYLYF